MEKDKYKYIIKLDQNNRIIECVSTTLIKELETHSIIIGEGFGAQFRATIDTLDNNVKEYANIENGLQLLNREGIYQLKYENGLIMKVSDEELQKEIDNLPKQRLSKLEQLEQENTILMESATIQFEENLLLKEKLAQQELKIEEQDEKIDNVMLGMTAMFEKGL